MMMGPGVASITDAVKAKELAQTCSSAAVGLRVTHELRLGWRRVESVTILSRLERSYIRERPLMVRTWKV